MQLIPVTNAKEASEFIQVNPVLHKNNPSYIRPLDKDVAAVFDPRQNKTFRNGKLARWILKDDKGKLLGRIAAYANKKYRSKGDKVPVGGCGFFDCINDQEAADKLFDVARHWLMNEGYEAMDGPINFGERDRWWGLLTEGFNPPLYCMNFNPPYYQKLFESYGFKVFYNQICYGVDPRKKLNDKLLQRHHRLAEDPNYSARHTSKNDLEKMAQDFTTVYNAAWAGHGGLKELPLPVVRKMIQSMKPVMDETLNWFVYYREQPIAMFINLPDLNQWFKYLHGKFDLFHKLKFLWVKRSKPCKKFVGLVFGIVPEFQGKGVDAYMIAESGKLLQSPDSPYLEYEMQWIGDFNPKMLNIAESMGETFRSRKLTTYRYLFDRTLEFERHPIL